MRLLRAVVLCAALLSLGTSCAVRFFLPFTHLELGDSMSGEQRFKVQIRPLLEGLIESLKQTPASGKVRRFALSEVGFIQMFLEENKSLEDKRLKDLKTLLASGQLEIVNGGVGEVDSANAFDEDIWANWFYGLQYLERVLDHRPKLVWHLHQTGQTLDALRVAKSLGFNDVFLAGVSDSVYKDMVEKKALQSRLNIGAGMFIKAHVVDKMGSPRSVDCDIGCDPGRFNKDEFLRQVEETSAKYQYDSFWLVGGAYNWAEAKVRFDFLDHIIEQVAGSHDIAFATPFMYLDHLNSLKPELPEYTGDISTKIINNHVYNGNLNLAPRLKYRVRRLWKEIRAAKNYLGWLVFSSFMATELRSELIGRVNQLCFRAAKLLHHLGLSGLMKTEVEDTAHDEITAIDEELTAIYQFVLVTNITSCDFAELELSGKGCEKYLEYLQKRGSIPVRIVNPTLAKASRLLKFVIPNSAQAGKYYIIEDKKELPSSLICFRGSKFCSLYFAISLDSCLSSKYIYLRATLKGQAGNRPARREHDFGVVGEDPINVALSQITIAISRGHFVVSDSMDPQITNKVALIEARPKDCSSEEISYADDEPFKVAGEIKAYSVFKTGILEGVFLKGDNFEIKVLQRVNSKHFAIELRVEPEAPAPKCRDLYLAILGPKGNSAEIRLDGTRHGVQKLITPIKSNVLIQGDHFGVTVFTSQPRGFFISNGILHLGLSRVVSGTRNQVVLAKFSLFNFRTSDDTDLIGNVFDEISRNNDVDLPMWFHPNESVADLGQRQRLLSRGADAKSRPTASIELASGLRFNTEFLTPTSFLMRLENRSWVSKMFLNPGMIIDSLYKSVQAFEVDDSTVFKVTEKRELKPVYEMKTGDRLTILVEEKAKRAEAE